MQIAAHIEKQKPVLFLCGITVLLLLPFLTKPFHIDDPMFIWAAQQIQHHHLDFYGFSVNWYHLESPMAEVNKNPPLVSYYIALSATVLGWSEFALHTAFLLPAILLVIGVYRLSEAFNSNATLTALSVLVTPAFLVSSTSIMADTMMTALWVWSIYYWFAGLDKMQNKHLVTAALLAALAGLTKFVAISILPLLMVYTLVKTKKPKNLFPLIITLAILAGYQYFMYFKYQQNFLTDVFGFAATSSYRTDNSILALLTTGIAFLGGSILLPLFYVYPLFKKNQLLWAIAILSGLLFIILLTGKVGSTSVVNDTSTDVNGIMHGMFFIAAGVLTLVLLVLEFKNKNNAESYLLVLWAAGIFIFACLVNWNTNARVLLPMVPAVSIMLWRQLDNTRLSAWSNTLKLAPLLPIAIISLALAWADLKLATASRIAADSAVSKYKTADNTVWFQGAWGFQYYMEQNGAIKLSLGRSIVKKNDIIVISVDNTNITPVPRDKFNLVEEIQIPTSGQLSLFSTSRKAGFYSSMAGSFPYRIIHNNPSAFMVVHALDNWRFWPE